MRYAKAALLTGLLKLDVGDRFGVVAFDHDQQWWTDCLVYATPENIRTCMMWVNDDISARGTTDIKTPLMQALRMLRDAPSQPEEVRLPLVFMLTDGEWRVCWTQPVGVPCPSWAQQGSMVEAGPHLRAGQVWSWVLPWPLCAEPAEHDLCMCSCVWFPTCRLCRQRA